MAKKILIVDEELSYRELLRDALRDQYKIIDTAHYDEAVILAGLNLPDLIIIDIELANGRGIELCEELKDDSETVDIPVMLISSEESDKDITQGLRAGATDFLVKPLFIPEVVTRIETHLRSHDYYSDLNHTDLLILLELSEAISVTRNPTAILRHITQKIAKYIEVERCSILSLKDGKTLAVEASNDLGKDQEISLDLSKYPELRKAVATKSPVIINDVSREPLLSKIKDKLLQINCQSILIIPLIKKESTIGTYLLRASFDRKNAVTRRVMKLCQLVSNISANAIENAALYGLVKEAQEHFEELSILDDLTQLYNRRYFYSCLESEFKRAVRHHKPLSLIFFDVDDFKLVNDLRGHAMGDEVLRQIGSVMKKVARKSDLPARFGGDEFAMILPETSEAGAYEFARRLSELLGQQGVKGVAEGVISVSVGVATFPGQGLSTCDELLKLADDAMYQSKGQGKGKISLAPDI